VRRTNPVQGYLLALRPQLTSCPWPPRDDGERDSQVLSTLLSVEWFLASCQREPMQCKLYSQTSITVGRLWLRSIARYFWWPCLQV